MSAYTTLMITRKKALEEVAKKLIGDISNSALEAMMDQILEPRLYNCLIIEEHEDNDDHVI